jgi:hypothetical protein
MVVVGLCVVGGLVWGQEKTPTPSPTPTIEEQAQQLRELLLSEDCTRACFMGIQVGITTQTEVQEFLVARNIDYAINDMYGNLEKDSIYEFSAQHISRLIDGKSVAILFQEAIVVQMLIGFDIDVTSYYHVFRHPSRVTSDNPSFYYLVPIRKMKLGVEERGVTH